MNIWTPHDPSLVLDLPLHISDGVKFMDRSAYGHKVEVTGALWTPQGRSFDGIDDYISGLVKPSIGSVLLWVSWQRSAKASGLYQSLLGDMVYQHTANDFLYLENGSQYFAYRPPLGKWEHLAFVWTTNLNSSVNLYVNTIIQGRGYVNDNGHLNFTRLATRENLTNFLKVIIGEVIVYNRALTAPERQHHYLATKWRYR